MNEQPDASFLAVEPAPYSCDPTATPLNPPAAAHEGDDSPPGGRAVKTHATAFPPVPMEPPGFLRHFPEPLHVPIPLDWYAAWLALPVPEWEPVITSIHSNYVPGHWPRLILTTRFGTIGLNAVSACFIRENATTMLVGSIEWPAPLPSLAPESATRENAWKLQALWALEDVPRVMGPDYACLTIQGGRIVEIGEEGILVYDSREAQARGEVLASMVFNQEGQS